MTPSKDQKISEVQANLPLPEQPPTASDWQSADARNVNVGSGRTEGKIGTDVASQTGLREPSTKGSATDMSGIGRTAEPKDVSER